MNASSDSRNAGIPAMPSPSSSAGDSAGGEVTPSRAFERKDPAGPLVVDMDEARGWRAQKGGGTTPFSPETQRDPSGYGHE